MIRKLKSGEYRLYSRKVDLYSRKRRNLGTFKTRRAAQHTSAPFSSSSTVRERGARQRSVKSPFGARLVARFSPRPLEDASWRNATSAETSTTRRSR
jgi:hypothetical protein